VKLSLSLHSFLLFWCKRTFLTPNMLCSALQYRTICLCAFLRHFLCAEISVEYHQIQSRNFYTPRSEHMWKNRLLYTFPSCFRLVMAQHLPPLPSTSLFCLLLCGGLLRRQKGAKKHPQNGLFCPFCGCGYCYGLRITPEEEYRRRRRDQCQGDAFPRSAWKHADSGGIDESA